MHAHWCNTSFFAPILKLSLRFSIEIFIQILVLEMKDGMHMYIHRVKAMYSLICIYKLTMHG